MTISDRPIYCTLSRIATTDINRALPFDAIQLSIDLPSGSENGTMHAKIGKDMEKDNVRYKW